MNIISRKGTIRLLCTYLTLLLSSVVLFSQTNPSSISFAVKNNDSYTFTVESKADPIAKINLDLPDWGFINVSDEVEPGIYDITYTAPSDYEGPISFVIEYSGVTGFPFNSYSGHILVNASVNKSLIEVGDDIILLDENTPIDILPLNNDVLSDGPAKIVRLAGTLLGEALIANDETIHYIPSLGFEGRDIINYVIEDTIGNKSSGNIYILSKEKNPVLIDTIELTVSSENDRYIFLPVSGMELITHNSDIGNINKVNDLAYLYQPSNAQFGTDQVVFQFQNIIRVFNIRVLDNRPDLDLVRDDRYYTAVNKEIVFNVIENDFIDPKDIIYYSPELEDLGDGNFRFVPESGYRGFKKFIYRVNTGSETLSGEITIKVDNYYPLPIIYEFYTNTNQPLVIEYNVPVAGYDFEISSFPNGGDLEVFSNNTKVDLDCGIANGKSLIIFTPKGGFTGTDAFDLEYCIDGDQCKVVKFIVEVLPGQDCSCIDNCVWPGDADNNGIVELSDLLAIGYYMGETGFERDVNNIDWKAQAGDAWNYSQSNGENLMYVDADGDGYVTMDDSVAIFQNIGNYHSLIPSSISEIKKSPLILIPRTTEVDSGDVMIIDIALGNESFPVLDMHGISFQINIDPSIMDSSSLDVIFYDDSWLGDGFGVMDKYNQLSEGRVGQVVSRTDRRPVSGYGIIGSTSFIVEDDLEGFRLSKDIKKLPFYIDVSGITAYDSDGNTYTLPSEPVTITLDLENETEEVEEVLDNKLYIYPNPASDILNVHLNGQKNIKSVQLFDLLGRNVYSRFNLKTDRVNIDVSRMNEGIYFLEVTNGGEIVTQKIKVSK